MANSLSAVIPQLLAQGLLALRESAFMPMIVNRGYESQAGQRGSSVDVPIPSAVAADDVTPSNAFPTNADIGPTQVSIPLDQWKEAAFYLTDKELLEVQRGIIPMQASEAIKALANTVNAYLLGLYKKFYGYVGTAGTTPFAANTTGATQCRKVLNKQLAPTTDRRLVIDPDAEANALELRALQDASWRGNTDVITNAQIGRTLGFDWFSHQLTPTHTAGTASSATVTLISDSDAGDEEVTLKVASGTATLVEGDIFTIAGHTQTYVVTAAKTLDTTGVAVAIAPPLKTAVDGSSVAVSVTVKGTHVANIAFHRDAIAFASRPFDAVPEGLGSITSSAVDEESGLTLRLEVNRQFKQTRYSYDILYGAQVVRRELGTRLAG